MPLGIPPLPCEQSSFEYLLARQHNDLTNVRNSVILQLNTTPVALAAGPRSPQGGLCLYSGKGDDNKRLHRWLPFLVRFLFQTIYTRIR